ncbi:MAG: colanic acid biosynthesis acetyltransferase WcaF [Bacteroidetes bacterium]|nr:MAG: colanic acid biosynthesis acetyltransferase WcaF [Bacteroidota bacterium]
MQSKTELSSFDNDWYRPGAPLIVRALWYLINRIYFISYFPFSSVKVFWLRLFGAKIGKDVVLKPHINIKYPWRLSVGNYSWIGEGAWIDNLDDVVIGDNCCISQGALLLCGNHNYKKTTFDLMMGRIVLEDGVWIGAKSIVCGGVVCKSHSVLTAGSLAADSLDPYSIYQGNPAVKIKEREITAA